MKIKLTGILFISILVWTPALSQQTPLPQDFIPKLIEKADREQKQEFNKSLEGVVKIGLSADVYSRFISRVHSSLQQSSELNLIAQKINPSDSTLTGQSYTTFIRKTAEEVFLAEATDEENKSRIKSIISNLANKKLNDSGTIVGSIISGFANSNPVINLATNIVSGIATFFKAKKESLKGKDVIVSLKESISSTKLQEFKSKIAVYSNFYDKALGMNIQFDSELKKLIADATAYNTAAATAINDLRKYGSDELKINVGNLAEVQGAFKYDFEKLYLNSYDNRFFVLVNKAKKVDSLYLLTVQLDARAQTIINGYVQGVNLLMTEFLKNVKGSKASFVAIEPNAELFKVEMSPVSFAEYTSVFPVSDAGARIQGSAACCNTFDWKMMIVILLANIFLGWLMMYYLLNKIKTTIRP